MWEKGSGEAGDLLPQPPEKTLPLHSGTPAINAEAMERLRTLQASLPQPAENVIAELLSHFRRDAIRHLQTAQEIAQGPLSEPDRARCADAFHALKGAASAVGADRVRQLAAAHERSLRQAEGAPSQVHLAQLEAEVQAAITALEAWAA